MEHFSPSAELRLLVRGGVRCALSHDVNYDDNFTLIHANTRTNPPLPPSPRADYARASHAFVTLRVISAFEQIPIHLRRDVWMSAIAHLTQNLRAFKEKQGKNYYDSITR